MTAYISNELKKIAGRLRDHDHEGMVMTGDEVGALARRLSHLADASQLLESEVIRHRRDKVARDRLCGRPVFHGSNVIEFPRPEA